MKQSAHSYQLNQRICIEVTNMLMIHTHHNTTSWSYADDFMKDIGLLVEGNNRDNDSLSLDVFQVGLRQHSHRHAAAIFGEDEGVATQTHGARLETVPVHTDGLLTGLTWTLFCKTKAGHKSERESDDIRMCVLDRKLNWTSL